MSGNCLKYETGKTLGTGGITYAGAINLFKISNHPFPDRLTTTAHWRLSDLVSLIILNLSLPLLFGNAEYSFHFLTWQSDLFATSWLIIYLL